MRIQVSVFVLIFVLGVLTAIFLLDAEVGYAVPSAEAAGGDQTHKDNPSVSEADKEKDIVSILVKDYPKLAAALVVYIVVSIVLEAALTVLFNWRWFIRWGEGKGLKAPVAWLIGYSIVWTYGLDIMRDVGNALMINCTANPCDPWKTSIVGQVLTAFVLAGGTQGVSNVLSKLKIRDQLAREARVAEIASA